MKYLALLFVLFFISIEVSSQNNTTVDTLRNLYTTAYREGNAEVVQKAAQDCQLLIADYTKNNDFKNLAKAYTLFGQILVEAGAFAEAQKILIKALNLSTKEFGPDAYETLEAKKYLSWAYGYMGDTDIELKYSIELLESYKKDEGKYALDIADLYNTMGINYGLRNDREKEREQLFIAQKMLENYQPKDQAERIKVQTLLMNVFNSLSLSYISSIDYNNAVINARKSLQISQKIAPNSPERAPTMVVIARCYAVEKKCDSAIIYINNALNLLESNQLKGSTMWLSYRSYKVNILARCGNADQAKEEAISTIKILLAKGISPEEALSQLMILTQQNNAELTTMENQYREKETIAAQKQTRERFLLVGLLFSLLLISGVVFVINRNRQIKKEMDLQKKEIQLQKSEIEKSVIENSYLRSRMDPHFVSNCIRSVTDFIDKNETKQATEYLKQFDTSMRSLVNNSSLDLVTLADELKTVENYLELEKPRITNGLQWEINMDDEIDAEEVELPPLILQPFVENAIKHGINGIERIGKITLSCKKIADKINITIEDNGRGINVQTNTQESKGLKITRERFAMFTKINNADADFKISSLQQGTKVTISFNS